MSDTTDSSNDMLRKKAHIIVKQTTYTEEEALAKLSEFNHDEVAVIRHFFGIPERKTEPIKSVNQAIYKQLRSHLDGAMKDYRTRVDKGEDTKAV